MTLSDSSTTSLKVMWQRPRRIHWRKSRPHPRNVSKVPKRFYPKQDLDPFGRVCTARPRDGQCSLTMLVSRSFICLLMTACLVIFDWLSVVPLLALCRVGGLHNSGEQESLYNTALWSVSQVCLTRSRYACTAVEGLIGVGPGP